MWIWQCILSWRPRAYRFPFLEPRQGFRSLRWRELRHPLRLTPCLFWRAQNRIWNLEKRPHGRESIQPLNASRSYLPQERRRADSHVAYAGALKEHNQRHHPDSITLTEAAESLEEKGLLPNLLDPNQTTIKANPWWSTRSPLITITGITAQKV